MPDRLEADGLMCASCDMALMRPAGLAHVIHPDPGVNYALCRKCAESRRQATAAAEAERDALRDAVQWVLRDMGYKAPEQARDAAGAWHAKLSAALTGPLDTVSAPTRLAPTPVSTVGTLRDALAQMPDDAPIYCQVVGTHHASGAWTMFGTVGEMPKAQPRKLVISLSHPEMPVLPMFDSEAPDDGTTRYGGTCPACGVRTELVHQCAPKVPDDLCVMCGKPDASTIHRECQ